MFSNPIIIGLSVTLCLKVFTKWVSYSLVIFSILYILVFEAYWCVWLHCSLILKGSYFLEKLRNHSFWTIQHASLIFADLVLLLPLYNMDGSRCGVGRDLLYPGLAKILTDTNIYGGEVSGVFWRRGKWCVVVLQIGKGLRLLIDRRVHILFL